VHVAISHACIATARIRSTVWLDVVPLPLALLVLVAISTRHHTLYRFADSGYSRMRAWLQVTTHCHTCRKPNEVLAGETAPLAFSIGYAAPEVIHALEHGERSVVADPAVDIWALGVIAFELITKMPAFDPGITKQAALDITSGRGQFPWEKLENRFLLSSLQRLKGTILSCLDRNAAKRPSAASLVDSWNHFFDANTTMSHTQSRFVTVSSASTYTSDEQPDASYADV
jgi:serine/threonine protein kinase